MGDEFLPGAGFSLDEDSRIRRSDLLHLVEHRFERSAAPYDPLECPLDLIRHRGGDGCTFCHRQIPHRIFQGQDLGRLRWRAAVFTYSGLFELF